MYKTARLSILLSSFLFVFAGALKAQQVSPTDEEKAYNKVVTQRAAKITAVLNISDSLKADRVTGIIANQYKALNQIHDQAKAEIKAVREKYSSDKAAAEEKVKVVENERRGRLYMLHAEYLGKLHAELSAAQVDKVKDGMTYGVFPLTYNGYLDMLPNLIEAQKTTIRAMLFEAREHAMDAGSSEEKHGWFGKYKGRINNYLSAAGYDLNKESKAWQERLKAAKEKPKK